MHKNQDVSRRRLFLCVEKKPCSSSSPSRWIPVDNLQSFAELSHQAEQSQSQEINIRYIDRTLPFTIFSVYGEISQRDTCFVAGKPSIISDARRFSYYCVLGSDFPVADALPDIIQRTYNQKIAGYRLLDNEESVEFAEARTHARESACNIAISLQHFPENLAPVVHVPLQPSEPVLSSEKAQPK